MTWETPQHAGIRKDPGISTRINEEAFLALDAKLRDLPGKVRESWQRRALRVVLVKAKRDLEHAYRQHRSKMPGIHLDQSIHVVSRVYRKGLQSVVWGAMGFRMPRGRVAVGSSADYRKDFAGWRGHFSERGFTVVGGMRKGERRGQRGTFAHAEKRRRIAAAVKGGGGRFVPGQRYLEMIPSWKEAPGIFADAVRRLIATEGKRA